MLRSTLQARRVLLVHGEQRPHLPVSSVVRALEEVAAVAVTLVEAPAARYLTIHTPPAAVLMTPGLPLHPCIGSPPGNLVFTKWLMKVRL